MDITPETLAAADLADRWIEAILSEKPEMLVASGDKPDPAAIAQALADVRRHLIEALADQPLPALFDGMDDDDDEWLDALVAGDEN